MLNVDKFTYPRKQTRGNEFIPCSSNICDILKRFRSFKIPAITLIWPKSPYKHSVTRSYRSGEESGRRSESPLWRHHWRSFVFISHVDAVKREIWLHIWRLLTNQKREYIYIYICVCVCVCVCMYFIENSCTVPFLPPGAWAVSRLAELGSLRARLVGCICLHHMLLRTLCLNYNSCHWGWSPLTPL